ncbi:MAG: CbiX/SirB N-terminal domain-containing protein [Desulfobacula sp.]|nr:CbiX/SirB N-terminal domain-containing protein [Desulfobacula sp.]
MKCLIIAAHGSRKKESNQELVSLTARVAIKLKKNFDRVEHAFLQFGEPLIEEQIENLIDDGARKIVIFPFFIGSGSHILVDIPDLVKSVQQKYGHIEFKITRHLGKISAIEDVIVNEVSI